MSKSENELLSAPPEFLLCGSPNDAFFSQIAFFRMSLDAFGPEGRAARVVAAFGSEAPRALPARWLPYFERIEVHHAAPEDFSRRRFFAASDLRYELLTPGARVSCLCDADTVLVRMLPTSFVAELANSPALCGVVAHFPFPITSDSRDQPHGLHRGMPNSEAWSALGNRFLGYPTPCPLQYTLLEDTADNRCPFYINYGFLAGPPDLLVRLHRALKEIQPDLERLLGNDFYGQVGIALAVEKLQLPWRALPMRYNFPNDRRADHRYPEELNTAVLIHYLRHQLFDRHRIFADDRAFRDFLELPLEGSDEVFQRHVAAVTDRRYPFA